jgi:hypothetical protein
LRVIGTESSTFGNVGQGRTSDPAETDNSMLRIGAFPRQGEGNQSCGLELLASTVGRRNICLLWDQYNSGTASRFWRIQYTTNGTDFIDHSVVTNSTPSVWIRQRRTSFSDVAGAENNPNFGLRFVSEFGAAEGYIAVNEGSNYSTAGTFWLDMVGLSGETIPDEPGPVESPALSISRGPELRLSWPLTAREFILESRDSWEQDWIPHSDTGRENAAGFEVIIQPEAASRFYRLRKPASP